MLEQSSEKNTKALYIIKQKIKSRKNMTVDFFNKVYHGEEVANKLLNKLLNLIKVFIASTRKFLSDDCLTKASAITYTIILSLIPTLTVVLTIYSIFSGVGEKKKVFFDNISLFMLEHNIKINVDQIFSAITGLIENAGKIGGISAAVMIFSATAMLRSLEKSLNDIWKVQKQRTFLLKIIYYWAALTLGPILLIAGTTVATQISSVLSPPNYKSAEIITKNNIWVVGNKASILYSIKDNLEFQKISKDHIDFDNQKVYKYDSINKNFAQQDTRVDSIEFTKMKFNDIQFIDNEGWIVGNDGIILHSSDNGLFWSLKKFGSYNLNALYMLNRQKGFISADGGVLLSTKDGGMNWDVSDWGDITANFTSIAFYNKRGIITGNRGSILYTENGGDTWEIKKINEAKRKDSYVNLNNSFFIDDKHIWLVGNEGIILASSDSGNTWKYKKFREINYYAACFINKNEGYVAGDDGTVIYTVNGGENWQKQKLPAFKINKLLFKDNSLWAFGDKSTIYIHKNKSWQEAGGQNLFNRLVNFFAPLISFLAPFVIIWLLFLLTYITLPNFKVPFKYALIGAAFTSSVWVIFILLFIVYIKAFEVSTFAIYGALAAIPLFLLIIYSSSVIILYGAEVSYTLMHPDMYKNLKKMFENKKDILVYHGLAILYHIYLNYHEGKGTTSFKEISKAVAIPDEEMNLYINLFLERNLIIKKDEDEYIPSLPSQNVKIAEVIDIINHISFDIPAVIKKSTLKSVLETLFIDIKNKNREILGNITLKDIIEKG